MSTKTHTGLTAEEDNEMAELLAIIDDDRPAGLGVGNLLADSRCGGWHATDCGRWVWQN